MNIYLIQSTDCLKPYAIQNAIVVAENRNTAIKKFSFETMIADVLEKHYDSIWT